MHICPSRGIPRNVAGAVLNMLFPPIVPAAFPFIVTGTNGKTTTTRLLAHIFKQTGRTVGYTHHRWHLYRRSLGGTNTGPQCPAAPARSNRGMLNGRGGILRSGLAFDASNVGVV